MSAAFVTNVLRRRSWRNLRVGCGVQRYRGRRFHPASTGRVREKNNKSRNDTRSNSPARRRTSQERRFWLRGSFAVALSALAARLKHLNESALARPINTQTLNNASGAATLLVSPSVL